MFQNLVLEMANDEVRDEAEKESEITDLLPPASSGAIHSIVCWGEFRVFYRANFQPSKTNFSKQ